MISTLKAVALRQGEKIHPLLGPIFTTRPASEKVGDPCAMCVSDNAPAPSDTVVRDAGGRNAYLCLSHDLMIQQIRHGVKDTIGHYENEVLAEILKDVSRPIWVPERLYSKLTARAKHKANQLSQLRIYSFSQRILEQETQIIHDRRILAQFEHETRNDKD